MGKFLRGKTKKASGQNRTQSVGTGTDNLETIVEPPSLVGNEDLKNAPKTFPEAGPKTAPAEITPSDSQGPLGMNRGATRSQEPRTILSHETMPTRPFELERTGWSGSDVTQDKTDLTGDSSPITKIATDAISDAEKTRQVTDSTPPSSYEQEMDVSANTMAENVISSGDLQDSTIATHDSSQARVGETSHSTISQSRYLPNEVPTLSQVHDDFAPYCTMKITQSIGNPTNFNRSNCFITSDRTM